MAEERYFSISKPIKGMRFPRPGVVADSWSAGPSAVHTS